MPDGNRGQRGLEKVLIVEEKDVASSIIEKKIIVGLEGNTEYLWGSDFSTRKGRAKLGGRVWVGEIMEKSNWEEKEKKDSLQREEGRK